MRGYAELSDVFEALKLAKDDEQLLKFLEEYSTIGGLLCSLAGEIPKAGDRLDFSGYEFTVTEVDDRRVLGVTAKLLAPVKSKSDSEKEDGNRDNNSNNYQGKEKDRDNYNTNNNNNSNSNNSKDDRRTSESFSPSGVNNINGIDSVSSASADVGQTGQGTVSDEDGMNSELGLGPDVEQELTFRDGEWVASTSQSSMSGGSN